MAAAPTIDPGNWLKHYRALADLEDEHKLRMREAGAVKLKLNAARDRAKRDGCDLGAMRLMDGLTRLSEAEAAARLDHLRHYLSWSGMPIGTQLGLPFNVEPDQDAVRLHDVWLAKREGRAAVEANVTRDSNPYEPGTEHHVQWDAGWRSSEPIPIAPARERKAKHTGRGRGRPPGSRNKPKATKVLSRLRRAERTPQAAAPSFDF
jgi:hypothetical protein